MKKVFLTFVPGETSMGGVKSKWGSNITIFLHFHYFISLETANTQKGEAFLLRIFLEMLTHSCYLLVSSNLQFQFLKRIFRNSL